MNGTIPSPQTSPNASLYPWSQRRVNFSSPQMNPFPRYGAAINSVASKEGDIYMMGGLIDGATVKGDLWMMESSTGNLSCVPIVTVSEGPGPRVGHASLLVGNAFIVFGGDTKMDENDTLDDTLYLLNTCMFHPSSIPRFYLVRAIGWVILTVDSLPTMVACDPSRNKTYGSLRTHIKHPGFKTLRIRRTSRGVLL